MSYAAESTITSFSACHSLSHIYLTIPLEGRKGFIQEWHVLSVSEKPWNWHTHFHKNKGKRRWRIWSGAEFILTALFFFFAFICNFWSFLAFAYRTWLYSCTSLKSIVYFLMVAFQTVSQTYMQISSIF